MEITVALLLMAAELFQVLSFFAICWDISFPRERGNLCEAMWLAALKSQVILQVNVWDLLFTNGSRQGDPGGQGIRHHVKIPMLGTISFLKVLQVCRL